jgi:predicted alpha/beta superfamily hydrolase
MNNCRAIVISVLLVLPILAVSPLFGSGESSAVREISLRSEILGEERKLLVRLPRDYEVVETRYPVLFLLDAEWHFNIAAADVEMLSECSYVKVHPIPQLIVVGLVNVDRNRDFTPTNCPEFNGMRFPTSGGAKRFRRFLIEEALPAIDRSYRTEPYRILAGWSLGGLFTIDTLLSDTPAFDAYLAISPSLWWDGGLTLKKLAAEPARKGLADAKQLTVTLGRAEKETLVANSTNEFMSHLSVHPLANLKSEQVPIEGLGHNYSPKMAYFMGLATIFADWNLPSETLDRGLAAIDAYYASLTARYHFNVPVPEDVYGNLGWKLFEAGSNDESGEVFRTWVERHPQSALAVASLGAFYRESGAREKAIALLRRAVELEQKSDNPRQAFILDLQRDVDALLQED